MYPAIVGLFASQVHPACLLILLLLYVNEILVLRDGEEVDAAFFCLRTPSGRGVKHRCRHVFAQIIMFLLLASMVLTWFSRVTWEHKGTVNKSLARKKLPLLIQNSLSRTTSTFLGSGRDRGRSPVEWGELQASGMAGWASGLAGWASGLAGWPRGGERTDGQMNGQTDGKSPHSTGLRSLSGPLPCLPL